MDTIILLRLFIKNHFFKSFSSAEFQTILWRLSLLLLMIFLFCCVDLHGCWFLLSNKEISPVPLPPLRRESFHFSPSGTNPPDYSPIITLAKDLNPGTLFFTNNDKVILKESYNIKSSSSYSYSETRTNPVRPDDQPINTANPQERKFSFLKLTPVTIPDPPAHLSTHPDTHPQSQSTGSLSPTPPPTKKEPHLLQPITITAPIPVNLGEEKQKSSASLKPDPKVELRVSDRAPTTAPSQVETQKHPSGTSPRPSPAELLVHSWPRVVDKSAKCCCELCACHHNTRSAFFVASWVTKGFHTGDITSDLFQSFCHWLYVRIGLSITF